MRNETLAATSLVSTCLFAMTLSPALRANPGSFSGSKACVECHDHQANSWQHSLHSRFMRTWVEEQEHPSIDWKQAPKAPFTLSKTAYVLGNMHKMAFLTRTAKGHAIVPWQLDIESLRWEPFSRDTWVNPEAAEGVDDAMAWEQLCAGCHTTGYDASAQSYASVNIECENCHGPGKAHAESQSRDDIVNPAALGDDVAIHVCARCHSRGRDKATGKPFATAYTPGDDLSKTFEIETATMGKNSQHFWGNGVAKTHHAQYNEFRQSKHFKNNVKCFDCHEVHRFRARPASKNTRLMARTERFQLKSRSRFICVKCHDNREIDYGTETRGGKVIDRHTHHPPVLTTTAVKTAGEKSTRYQRMSCPDCHMAQVADGSKGYDVISHVFNTPAPADTDRFKVANACNNCHSDKTSAWASQQIASWKKR